MLTKKINQKEIPELQEGFADRRYESRAILRNRQFKDAVIINPQIIISQYTHFKEGFVITENGKEEIECDTICFHGDNEASRKALKNFGWKYLRYPQKKF